MCGIAGFIDQSGIKYGDWTASAQRMSDSIEHRGPDCGGVWIDIGSGVGLAHRRLSVLDLSPAGHQPMMSACERYVITFNGEIYNHLDLRRELINEGHQWRGHSDTETLLAGFGRWGIKATLEKSVGMFALAVWDRKRQTLTLARDRLGEKPVYYGWQGGVFLFGSELKALKAHPAFCGE
ncbi:asparagine synthetase B, partial [Burkholderiaceae bacterium]|nr:asparagine synthetase B [Burkholderiaceae bacterium]